MTLLAHLVCSSGKGGWGCGKCYGGGLRSVGRPWILIVKLPVGAVAIRLVNFRLVPAMAEALLSQRDLVSLEGPLVNAQLPANLLDNGCANTQLLAHFLLRHVEVALQHSARNDNGRTIAAKLVLPGLPAREDGDIVPALQHVPAVLAHLLIRLSAKPSVLYRGTGHRPFNANSVLHNVVAGKPLLGSRPLALLVAAGAQGIWYLHSLAVPRQQIERALVRRLRRGLAAVLSLAAFVPQAREARVVGRDDILLMLL
mmetsp:Transcript_65557/g.55639  ORF Transcript_65557/g.55639 Transcript_65557/m.55639 type:complete len:256 (-) Transcript_65557:86-853(-)